MGSIVPIYIIIVSFILNTMDTILQKPEFKTIRLSTKNYARITQFGKYEETMDEIVNRILNQIENTGSGVPDIKK
jgi:hypothetical protein